MPQPRFIADAFGVVAIVSLSILIILGVLCIAYSLYLRSRIRSRILNQLTFFTSPWLVRIIFVLLTILWSVSELLRLSLLRRKGEPLNRLSSKWQDTICKGYIVANLGFAEPCLFLTLLLLLRASLSNRMSNPHWTRKTFTVLLLFTSPIFILHFITIHVSQSYPFRQRFPLKFTRSSTPSSLCTYPLLNTILSGIVVAVLSAYFLWIGTRIMNRVINRILRRRVYTLMVAVCCLFPMRVILIGLSAMSEPDIVVFEVTVFMGFFCLVWCLGISIWVVVYFPVADALSFGGESVVDESESISFRTYDRNGFVELGLFAPSYHSAL